MVFPHLLCIAQPVTVIGTAWPGPRVQFGRYSRTPATRDAKCGTGSVAMRCSSTSRTWQPTTRPNSGGTTAPHGSGRLSRLTSRSCRVRPSLQFRNRWPLVLTGRRQERATAPFGTMPFPGWSGLGLWASHAGHLRPRHGPLPLQVPFRVRVGEQGRAPADCLRERIGHRPPLGRVDRRAVRRRKPHALDAGADPSSSPGGCGRSKASG